MIQAQETVCSGSSLVETTEASQDDCPFGGTRYTFGEDTNGDGAIDNIVMNQLVCDDLSSTETIVYGTSVLFYSDFGRMNMMEGLQALDDLGIIQLTVADTNDEVELLLEDETFDVLIYLIEDNSIEESGQTMLENRIAAGEKTISTYWRGDSNDDYAALFEAKYTENNNELNITFLGSLTARITKTTSF